ncbi:hypothetical protein DMENIID0001_170650 [Sergentomyia squamirostris]
MSKLLKTQRSFIDETMISAALRDKSNGTLSFPKTSERYAIAKSILFNRMQKMKSGSGNGYLHATYLLTCSKISYGLSTDDLREIVSHFAVDLGKSFPETWKIKEEDGRKEEGMVEGMAGKKWAKGFLARHKRFSLRTPENTSVARLNAFNRRNLSPCPNDQNSLGLPLSRNNPDNQSTPFFQLSPCLGLEYQSSPDCQLCSDYQSTPYYQLPPCPGLDSQNSPGFQLPPFSDYQSSPDFQFDTILEQESHMQPPEAHRCT